MKASELRGKTDTELTDELMELRREQFNLRMQLGAGQSPRPDQFEKVRRDIARIKTIIRQRQGAGEANG